MGFDFSTFTAALAGEDRAFESGFFIDFRPENIWRGQIKDALDIGQWNSFADYLRARTKGKCELCRNPADKIELHERWDYRMDEGVQDLRRILSVCSLCRAASNWTRIKPSQKFMVQQHISHITGWDYVQLERHMVEMSQRRFQRNKIVWETRLDILTNSGLVLNGQAVVELDTMRARAAQERRNMGRLALSYPAPAGVESWHLQAAAVVTKTVSPPQRL